MVESTFSLKRPFDAKIERYYQLNKEGSTKCNHHVYLCIEGSDITYDVGSSFGLLPDNPACQVESITKALNADKDLLLTLPKFEKEISLEEFLTQHVNIFRTTKKLAKYLLPFQGCSQLSSLLEGNWKEYVENETLARFLHRFYNKEADLIEICTLLSPMLPRFYSVASSQKVIGNKIELLVANFSYNVGDESFQSITTNHLLTKNSIRLFLQKNHSFTLPEVDTPVIMIGPGTGIAAFKGFIQERIDHHKTSENVLFTGDRHSKFDYYYEDEFSVHENNGHLKVFPAFSRDNDQKVYVQHKMYEQKDLLYDLLFQKNAKLYVSGDAKFMAKDVMKMLEVIIAEKQQTTPEVANQVLRALKKKKHILLDVY